MADEIYTLEALQASSSALPIGSFTRRHLARQRNRYQLQSTEYSSRRRPRDESSEDTLQPLLLILRLLSHHDVHIFNLERGKQWNMRQALGEGSTFAVDEADLPLQYAGSDLQYQVFFSSKHAYFTDHIGTKWKYDTTAAYKGLVVGKDRDVILSDLINELRVLCHPPLQKHPNIVRLFGVAWTREQETFPTLVAKDHDQHETEKLREWPTLVTEKATHGTLSKFLKSEEFTNIRSSLSAKVRLCTDVLNGISVLHACDILHGDIKCENTLVFATDDGTAENWRAKLSDFSHSILNVDEQSHSLVRQLMPGTDLYSPPELNDVNTVVNPAHVKATDIWCWGMLLWEVLIDGRNYESPTGEHINKGRMKYLRDNGLVAGTARESCHKYLEEFHMDEVSLFEPVLEALQNALRIDASERPDAASLSMGLKQADGVSTSGFMPLPKTASLNALEALPFFEACLHLNLTSRH